jgi:CheY-like chemotaxis protein
MYSFVAVLIITMVSGILFLADAMWVMQKHTHETFDKLLRLETYAAQVQGELLAQTRTNEIEQRQMYAQTLLRFSDAISEFNTALDNPDWLSNRIFADRQNAKRIRAFQSQSLQMVQTVSLIMQADRVRDILRSKNKLKSQFHDDFFIDAEEILIEKQSQLTTLHRSLDIIAWLVVPILVLILGFIWRFMLSPMIKSQKRSYEKAMESKKSAQIMAKRAVLADQSKTQFLTVLSHELRTPLNGIIGLSEELKSQTMSDKGRETAAKILSKGTDLATLVDELITFTEIHKDGVFDIDVFMQSVHAKQKTAAKATDETPEFRIPKDYKILIADDNRTNRVVMDKLVKRMGGHADIVEDGAQAVDAYKDRKYDLLLLDIAMPNKTGDQAMVEIRTYEKANNTPPSKALAVTANTLREQVAGYYTSGFDDCLAKPINFARLSKKIATLTT